MAKDKYNIGLDIYNECIISGNSCVTVSLIELLKFEKRYTDALKQCEKNEDIIHNLINSEKFLLASIDTKP